MAKETKNLVTDLIHDRELKRQDHYLAGCLIDIGCGTKPYKAMLAHHVQEHVSVDHVNNFHDKSNMDLFGTAYQIPVPDETFDSAVCTAVLEHLKEPELALRECHPVLKPGGFAVYTVPFIWHLHEEPRDFLRYSRYVLEYLFQKTAFNVVNLFALLVSG